MAKTSMYLTSSGIALWMDNKGKGRLFVIIFSVLDEFLAGFPLMFNYPNVFLVVAIIKSYRFAEL